MEEKLTAELPGILAWAVRGCLDWQRHGLGMAEAVKVATEAYRADMDVLAAWLGECCILGKKYEVKASSLYASYTAWCESNGETAESQRKWGMRLAERSLRRDRRMIGFFWIGIGLLDPTHHEPNEPYEPEKAIFRANSLTKLKLPNKVHDGSYGSCNPSDTDISSHHPPVEPPPFLAELASLSGLPAERLLAGDLSEADWPKITDASAELAQRHHEGRDAISALISRIDAAYNRAEVSP